MIQKTTISEWEVKQHHTGCLVMKMRTGIIFSVALVIFAVFLVIQANILSISLDGYSFAYHDIVRNFLGKPPLYFKGYSDLEPFCGASGILKKLHKATEDMVCIELSGNEPPRENCDPVASAEIIPTYVFPFFDQITANIAVTVDDIDSVANFLEISSERALVEIVAKNARSWSNFPAYKKNIFSLQCRGYGLISIKQSYFNMK